jgi:DNA-binding NtrC family response regulator
VVWVRVCVIEGDPKIQLGAEMHITPAFSHGLLENALGRADPSAKVLIVEDNQVVSECLQGILVAYGYHPLVAATPDQAIEHCQRERNAIYALIIDVRLGQFRGFETAMTLLRTCPEMKVIFTSGYPYEHLVRSGLLPAQLGAATFLQKPFLAGDVISCLQASSVPDPLP